MFLLQTRIGGINRQRLRPDQAEVILQIEVTGVAQVADVQIFVCRKNQENNRAEHNLAPQRLKAKTIPATVGFVSSYNIFSEAG